MASGAFCCIICSYRLYFSYPDWSGSQPRAGRQNLFFELEDASGLIEGSQVKIAGIPIGGIKEIRYKDNKAIVTIALPKEIQIFENARIEIRSQGILGDKYVQIYPGDNRFLLLESGQQIKSVQDRGSLDKVMGDLGEVMKDLKTVSQNLSEAVTQNGTNAHILGRIIKNVEKITADIAQITDANKYRIDRIIANIDDISSGLNELINQPQDNNLKTKINQTLNRLDRILANLEEVTDKVKNGQGTLGKLISDEQSGQIIENTLEAIDTVFGGVTLWQTALNVQSFYLSEIGGFRTTAGLRLDPGPDRHYFFGITDDPAGVVEIIETKTTSGNNVTQIREEKRYLSRTRFNLWFGKTFWNLGVRAGIIENSAAIAFDYFFDWSQRWIWTNEFLEFANLNWRSHLQVRMIRGVYFVAGFQDILNNSKKASSYFGINVLISNDDLLLLMSRMPSF